MAVSETNTFKEQGLQWKDECSHEEEEDEALSLSDLPIFGRGNCESNDTSSSSSCLASEAQDFEFGSWVEEDLPMCAADEVFFQGQILPLRPSVSSECGLLSGFRPDSRCGSMSDSMDRSLGRSSSMFSSRSHSLSSSSSTFKYLYTHPTPKPQMGSPLKRNAAKTSRKSGGWGLFRLGLVRTPEIELQDLKFRKRNSICKNESRKSTGSDGEKNLLEKKVKQEQGLQRFFGGGLSCKCTADAVDTVSSRIVVLKSRKGEAMSRRRTFEWLKELSIAETPVA